jgi:hypothetical protein
MQMGRWFGYRDKYLDVCRLYTSREMIEWFGHIADAAEELRQEFDNMVAVSASPKEFGLRVKSHSILTVTSKAKMRSAQPVHLTYSGDLLQTVAFPVDDRHEQNFTSGETLIRALGPAKQLQEQKYVPAGQNWNGALWRDVGSLKVIEFLRSYQPHPSSYRVVTPMIADFINGMNLDGELTRWTIALVGASAGDTCSVADVEVGMLERKGIGNDDNKHSIKTLISPRDQAIDLSQLQYDAALARSKETWRGDAERNESQEPPKVPKGPAIRHILGFGHDKLNVPADRERGLLLLYVLDPEKSRNEILKERKPVLAWSISFPGSPSKRRVRDADYMGNSVLLGVLNNDLE